MKEPPPKRRKRRLCGPALKTTLTLSRFYRVGRLLQAPFGGVFWFFEQKLARLQDQIANLESVHR